jgi:hypothetical protein
MKFVTTTALAALLIAGASTVALAPAASAGDATGSAPPAATGSASSDDNMAATGNGQWRAHPGFGRFGMGHHWGMGGPRGGAGLLGLACGDRGAEALEIAFVHLNYAVKPTAEQQPLFDALRTAALADQKTFSNACQSAMSSVKGGKATILDRLEARLTLDNARAAALSDIVPKFKAFYDSLTDAQRSTLDQRFGGRWGGPHAGTGGWNHHPGWNHGPGRMGPGMMGRGHMGPGPSAGAPGDNSPPDASDTPAPSST